MSFACTARNPGNFPSHVELINSILWDSANEIWNNDGSTINIAYSFIAQGRWPGAGNLRVDPLLVDADGPDNIPGTEDDNPRLTGISPGIDAGDRDDVPGSDETDLDGNPRLVHRRVDMGAYEFQGAAPVPTVYVDDDAPDEPGPGELGVSDPLEDGSAAHPFDSIQEAIDITLELIEGDYHLRSQGWRWNTESQSWTYDSVTSPCVDAGNPGSPLRDEPVRVPRDPGNEWGVNLRINMGAYGGTRQASIAPHGWALLADLSNDGCVDYLDLATQPGDLNRDGLIDLKDLAALAENWRQRIGWFR